MFISNRYCIYKVLGGFGSVWVVLAGFGWFWLVPCFSNYAGKYPKCMMKRVNYK